MISTKNSTVKFKSLTPAMAWILYRLENFHRVMMHGKPNLVITSINDGTHAPNSRHYIDEAIDIRSKNFESLQDKLDFCARFEDMLGPKFRVMLENIDQPNEHFHVQVRKGLAFNGVD